MRAKFKVGDMVRFGSRAPVATIGKSRRRARKVVAAVYLPNLKATRYVLGGQGGTHESRQTFRSYELVPVSEANSHKIGRPKGDGKVRMTRLKKPQVKADNGVILSHQQVKNMLLNSALKTTGGKRK